MSQISNSPDATNNYDIAGVDYYTNSAVLGPGGQAANGSFQYPFGAGAIFGKKGTAVLIGTHALAMTLALPIAGQDDGKTLTIYSITAYAHTITCPAGVGAIMFPDGLGNIITFTAAIGNAVTLVAVNGIWCMKGTLNGTLSGT
jgi:hypothetical protein